MSRVVLVRQEQSRQCERTRSRRSKWRGNSADPLVQVRFKVKRLELQTRRRIGENQKHNSGKQKTGYMKQEITERGRRWKG